MPRLCLKHGIFFSIPAFFGCEICTNPTKFLRSKQPCDGTQPRGQGIQKLMIFSSVNHRHQFLNQTFVFGVISFLYQMRVEKPS
jgi:hypothetical protein